MASDSNSEITEVVQRYDSSNDAQVLMILTNFSAANSGVYTCSSDYEMRGIASRNSSVLIVEGDDYYVHNY